MILETNEEEYRPILFFVKVFLRVCPGFPVFLQILEKTGFIIFYKLENFL